MSLFSLVLLSLILLGLYLRLANISALEPHVDESGNVLASVDPVFRDAVRSGEYGKPLRNWLFRMAPVWAQLTNHDLVNGARVQGAVTGVVTAILLGLLMWREASVFAGFTVLVVWLLIPFTVLHDRLVLLDPYCAFFCVLCCTSLSVAVRCKQLCASFFLFVVAGIFAGAAILNKITAVFDLPWLLCFGLYVCGRSDHSQRMQRLISTAAFGCIAVVLVMGSGDLVKAPERLEMYRHHLPDLGHIHGVLKGVGILPSTLLSYAGLPGLALIVVGFRAGLGQKDWWVVGVGFFLSLSLYAIAYSQTAWARYYMPLFVPTSIISAAGYSCFFRKAKRWRFKMCMLFVFAAVSVYWVHGVWSLLRNPLSNRWSKVDDELFDYESYNHSWWSGNGLASLIRGISGTTDRPILVVAGGWHPSTNALSLHCFESQACSVRRIGESQVDADFILDAWWRRKAAHERLFLVGDDHCAMQDGGKSCRGTILERGPGVLTRTVFSVPRVDGQSFFRVAEVVGRSPQGLSMEVRAPSKDRFLAPQARVTLGSEFETAAEVEIAGIVPAGLSQVKVRAFLGGEVVGDFQLTEPKASFRIPLKSKGKEGKRELHLWFDDWVAIPDRSALIDGYWGGSRAVSFHVQTVEPIRQEQAKMTVSSQ